MRVSQGLVHTLTAAVAVVRGVATTEIVRGMASTELVRGVTSTEVVRGVASTRSMVFNHYLICNDTLEELHFGQVGTNLNVIRWLQTLYTLHRTLLMRTFLFQASVVLATVGEHILVTHRYM